MKEEKKKKQKRSKPIEMMVKGIPFHYNPLYQVRGRYKTRLFVCNPKSKKNFQKLKEIEHTSTEKCMEDINIVTQKFLAENMDQILEWIEQRDLDPTLNNWYAWYKQEVTEDPNIGESLEECDAAWSLVANTMGEVKLSQIRPDYKLPDVAKSEMEAVFRRNSSIHDIKKEEKLAWRILNKLVELLVQAGLLETNSIKAIARVKTIPASTVSSRALSQRSFSRVQMSGYLQRCERLENKVLGNALITRAALGLTVYELCGLNLDSVVDKRGSMQLEIVRRYYQKQGKEPERQEKWGNLNNYRSLPCSLFLQKLLSTTEKLRKQNGADGNDPLFVVDGERIRPEMIKELEKELLNEVLQDSELRHQKGDFIRSNAEYYLLNVSEMTRAETEFVLGRDRVHTYAVNYVDWNNALVSHHLARKLDRWHSAFLQFRSDDQYGQRRARVYFLHVAENAVIKVSCEGEMFITLSRYEG